jgi:hypothetical protein
MHDGSYPGKLGLVMSRRRWSWSGALVRDVRSAVTLLAMPLAPHSLQCQPPFSPDPTSFRAYYPYAPLPHLTFTKSPKFFS